MPSAAYYRAWRADHPAYRAREVARSARNKALKRLIVEVEQPPPTHPFLEQARLIVGPLYASRGREYRFPPEMLHEELVAEAALAICEGCDPCEAMEALRKREAKWLKVTTWLADEDGDGRLDRMDQRMA